MLGQKRRERRHHHRQLFDHGIQRAVSRDLVGRDVLTPEPVAIQPDITVGQLVDELEQARNDVVQPVFAHLRADVFFERLQARQNPLVEYVAAVVQTFVGRPVIDRRVRHQELECVIPRQQRAARHVLDAGVQEQLFLAAHQTRVDQIQAQRIGAVDLHQFVRRRVVAQPLRHLAAVAGDDHAVDDRVAERRFFEKRRRQHGQRIEPAARLIEALGDELCRETSVENALILERIVQLRVRHRAGLEPAIQHFFDAAIRPFLAGHVEGQRIDELAMQVRQALSGITLELVERADAQHVARDVVDPDRQRRAPDAVARNRPVDCAFQPVAESAVLDVRRNPTDLFVRGQQVVDDTGDAHVPRRDRAIDQRRVRAIAERIAVLQHALLVQRTGFLEALDDVLVGVFDVSPREVRHFVA